MRQWQVISTVSKPLDQDGNQALPINVPSLGVVLPASPHLSASGVWVSPSLLQTVADLPKCQLKLCRWQELGSAVPAGQGASLGIQTESF